MYIPLCIYDYSLGKNTNDVLLPLGILWRQKNLLSIFLTANMSKLFKLRLTDSLPS
jgi:hypothetical protein